MGGVAVWGGGGGRPKTDEEFGYYLPD